MSCFIRKSIFPYSLIYWIHTVQCAVTSKEVFKLSEPSKCKNNEYFDSVSFSCTQCDTTKNLIPSEDRQRCVCNKFSKRIGFNDGYPLCVPCRSNFTVTLDGNDCVACNSTTCKCASNEIRVDRGLNGTLLENMYCLPCPDNTYPFLDGARCLPCKHFEYNYYVNDLHFTRYHYTSIKEYCLPKHVYFYKQNPKFTFQVKFHSKSVDSYYFKNELPIAIYFCKKKDRVACEHLSNMCALSLYANNVACKLFMRVQNSPVRLFHNKNETLKILNSKRITQEYSFVKGNNGSTLNFTVATFSLHGKLKSIGAPNMPCNFLKHVRFGINVEKNCKLAVKDLIQAQVEFISPYLTFTEDDNILMYPLPGLIKNINQNNNEITDWQLVRKFFFVDNISGFRKLSNRTNDETEKVRELAVLRYIKSLNVIINVQSKKEKNKIFPPLLIIEYAELTDEEIDKIVEVTVNYKIKFTIKDYNINSYLMIVIGICSGLSLILSGIKAWSYSKRHHVSTFNISVYIWFFIYTLSIIGSIIILCLVSLCLYLFIFYKGQTVPYILLSEDINEKTIKILTTVASFFKLVEMFGFIFQYWNTDVYFIDWEQPKTYNQSKHDPQYESISEFYIDKLSKNKYKHFQMPSEAITAKRKKLSYKLKNKYRSPSGFNKCLPSEIHTANASTISTISGISTKLINENNDSNDPPISIWRTFFVASQWLKLQTKRKISVTVQWLGVLCTFQIIQLCPWIFAMPKSTFFSEDNYNFIMYYTVCVLVYILVYCIQWLISIVFCELCITNKIQEFINLCSIANISVLILPFNYYGFYIHGRSVHGFADTNLPTLINGLQMEKNNLCAHRGLVPGTIQQTFILYLTKTFRATINKDFEFPKIKQSNFIKTYYSTATNWDRTFNIQLKLKQFLCKFIDHCTKEEDYIVKEQQFFEKLFNIVFSNTDRKSIFYIDNNYSFNQILLYGNEWLLATFEISVYTFIITLHQDYTLGITVMVFISILSTVVIKYNSKRNLNERTLLGKMFLK